MMPCIKRAIWSAPPPAPAMMINSTGFLGFQPWLPATATEVVKPSAKAPTSNDLITLIMFLHFTTMLRPLTR